MKHLFEILFFLIILSCSKEKIDKVVTKPPSCDSAAFTFDKNIRPIINSYCNFSECHGTGGEGSYDFTQYDVVAGRVKAGTFEYRIELPNDDPQHMPSDLHLNDCNYFKIKTWIKQGFPN